MSDPQPNGTHDSDEGEQEQPSVLMPQSGPDRDEMASDYLPEENDWLAKTVLNRNDPQAIAALSQFEDLFDDPAIQDTQPAIDGVLYMFMRGRTSVQGQSRKEYKQIIEAMFGGHPDDQPGSMIAGALAGEKDDD